MKRKVKFLSVLLVLVILLFAGSDLWSTTLRGLRIITSGEEDATLSQSSVAPKKTQRPTAQERRVSFNIPDSATIQGIIRIKLTEAGVAQVERKAGKTRMIQSRAVNKPMNVGITSLNEKLELVKATKMKRVFPYHPRFEARQRAEGLHLWYEIEVDNNQSAVDICKQLSTDASIKIAEPALKRRTLEVKGGKERGKKMVKGVELLSMKSLPLNGKTSFSSRTSRTPFPASARKWEDNPPVDDPMLLKQWHYYNYGQIGGDDRPVSDVKADIDLFDAWEITMGDPRVIVSVHDQGVDFRHPDLEQNMWVNTKELNGTLGVDDDGNGFVDDIYGYNFAKDGGVNPGAHGTHVSGTIAASNNNGIGVAGIAGGNGNKPGVRIMSCQLLDNDMDGTGLGVGASFVYAANNGAVISQNSWGYNVPDMYEQSELDGIDYFIKYAGKDENGRPLPNTPMVGGIVIFSAGNDGIDADVYPGCYKNVLCVGATGPWNEQAPYTNFGAWVDIAAPGGNTSMGDDAGVLSLSVTGVGQDYGYMQGTSMACPHVSGVAALILSKYGHESYTSDMLWDRLVKSAIPWSELNPAFVGKLGVGLLNAARALQSNSIIAPDSITDLRVKSVGYDYLTVSFTSPKDKDNGSAHSYEVRYSKEPITEENVLQADVVFQLAQKAGTTEKVVIDYLTGKTKYYITVRSTDFYGNRSKMSAPVEATTSTAPLMSVTPDSLTIEVAEAKVNAVGEAIISIANLEGGDLRYSMRGALTNTPQIKDGIYYQYYSNIENFTTTDFTMKLGEDGSARFLAASRFDVKKKPFVLTHIRSAIVSEGVFEGKVGYSGDTIEMKIVVGGKTPADGHLVSRSGFVIPGINYLLNYQQDLMFIVPEIYEFAPGEHFWVVFDFPKGFSQPMRLNTGTKSPAGYELYSAEGKDWTDVNTLNIGDLPKNYAYRIFPFSDMPTLPDNIFAFDPKEGYIAADNKQSVKVKVNTQKLVEGKYQGYASVVSNDPKSATRIVPLKLSIKGHQVGLRTVETFSVGSAVQGYSCEKEFTVYNDSLGILRIDTIYSTEKQFTLALKKDKKDTYKGVRTSAKIAQGDSAKYIVTFNAPLPPVNESEWQDSVGNFLAELVFETNATTIPQGEYKIVVDAISTARPVFTIDRAIDSIDLSVGEKKTVTFKITNNGKYRLDYTVGTDMIADYDYSDLNPNMKEYFGKREEKTGNFASIAYSGVKINESIRGTQTKTIPLPFSFTSYGVKYDTITIRGNGMICLGNKKEFLMNSNQLGSTQPAEPATLFPYYTATNSYITLNRGGNVYVKVDLDKVTIEYQDCGEEKAMRVNVQTIIYANGDIRYLHNLPWEDGKEVIWKDRMRVKEDGSYTLSDEPWPAFGLIGLTDPTGLYGVGIHSLNLDKSAGRYYAGIGDLQGDWAGSYYTGPGGEITILDYTIYPAYLSKGYSHVTTLLQVNRTFAKEVTPSHGSLLPGKSADITLNLQMDNELVEALYAKSFAIKTNDPLAQDTSFLLNIHWKSEMKPELAQTGIDYGVIGKDVPTNREITLRNKGGKAFKATARLETGTHFTLKTPIGEANCNGLSALSYVVEFTPTEEKEYTDRLIIELGEGIAPLSAQLRGRGGKRPLLVVADDQAMNFTFSLSQPNNRVDTAIIISNAGDSDLNYNLATSDWIKQTGIKPMSGMDKTGYFWSDNTMDKAVSYEWIWNNPTLFSPLGKNPDGTIQFSAELDIPFNFPYYGEKYTKCYANMSGMIYFQRGDIQYTMLFNSNLGDGVVIPQANDFVSGFIAPMAGSFDLPLMYHETVGEGDDQKFVITFSMRDLMQKNDTTRAIYQAVLYKDGRIKFQYKDVENALWRGKKTIGMENRAGDDGLSIAYVNKEYIKNNLAIMIAPSTADVLKPGEKKRLSLAVTTDGLLDGTFDGTVLIRSNDARTPQKVIAVSATVMGSTQSEYIIAGEPSKTLDYGKVLRYDFPISHEYSEYTQKYGYTTEKAKYRATVRIKNTGTRKMTISRVALSNLADNFPMSPFGASKVKINPRSEWTLELNLRTIPMVGILPTGDNKLYYEIYDRCEGEYGALGQDECEKLGYTHKIEEFGMFGSTDVYVKIDTIEVLFNLSDVPNEVMNVEKTVNVFPMNTSTEKGSFQFDVKNPAFEANYWKAMHNDTNRMAIEKQSDLTYQLVATDLTRTEYEELLKNEAPKAQVRSFEPMGGYAKAVAVGNYTTHAYAALSASAPSAAAEQPTFIDSLGYSNFAGYFAGYTANGPGQKFTNYVRYRSGAEGFNLTHVQSMMAKYTKYPEEGFDFEIKVFVGKLQDQAQEIYSETQTLEVVKDKQWELKTLQLAKPVYIYPNQYYWVAIVNKNNTMVSSIYWAIPDYTQELWDSFVVDNEDLYGYLATILDGPYGWAINCFSAQKQENPTRWITLSRESGELKAGEVHTVSVDIDPAKDLNGLYDRYAKVSITSNDPYPFGRDTTMRCGETLYEDGYRENPVILTDFIKDRGYMLVRLRINQAPEFVGTKAKMTVEENADSTFMVKILDFEGDRVTGLTATLDSAYNVEKGYNVVPTVEIGTASGTDTLSFPVKIKTGFEASGNYAYTLKTADAKGQERTSHLVLTVTNVNRAPRVVGNTTMVTGKELSTNVNLNGVFTDPDRQTLQYSAESINPDIVAVTVSDSTMTLYGWVEGAVSVKVTAIDPENAGKTTTFNVTVTPENAAVKNTTVSLYPNPVIDIINCDFSLDKPSNVRVRIFGSDGRLFYETDNNSYGEGKHNTTINVSSLPAGLYILQYLLDGSVKDTQKFIK